MTVPELSTRDDRILPTTRALAYAIAPFLLLAFAVLYPFPGDTDRLFAWHIMPTLTPMILGAAYLGGAYFFIQAGRAGAWHSIKAGFVPVGTFATLLGIATIIHWDRFNHGHVAFWLWVGLYFTTPFLVFGAFAANRRHEAPAAPEALRLPATASWVVAVVGAVALLTGAFLFLVPQTAARIWPWHLTPLTSRVLGAVFCLGLAGVGAPLDRRWSSARLPFQVAGVMLVLILVAGVRAHAELAAQRVLTWLFVAGFSATTAALVVTYVRMERLRAARPPEPGTVAQPSDPQPSSPDASGSVRG